MQPDCPKCQMWRDSGAKFCGGCGKELSQGGVCIADQPESNTTTPRSTGNQGVIYVTDPRRATVIPGGSTPTGDYQKTNPIVKLAMVASALLVIFIVANNSITIITNFDRIVDECSSLRFAFYIPYGFGDLMLFKFQGAATAAILGICVLAEIMCLVYAINRFMDALKREDSQNDGTCVEKSGLCACSSALCASLVLSVILLLMAAAGGNGASTSWMSEYTEMQMFFMLTRAGLHEEIIVRVIWIGLPMAIIAYLVHKDKRSWQHLFGGFGMSKAALVFIVFSSVLFGLAHLEGWGWGKVPSATVGGIIFAYLYVEYGLYASVLAHTANDTITTLTYTFGEGMSSLVSILLMIIGVVILIYWAIKLSETKFDVKGLPDFPEKLNKNIFEMWKRY